MAIETKYVTTGVGNEEKAITLWQSFGWKLKDDKYTRIRDRSISYSSLTFERDMEIKNYTELKALEDEYNASVPVYPDEPRFGWLILIVSTILLYAATQEFSIWLLIPGIVIALVRHMIYKEKYADANEMKTSLEGKREEVCRKARALL
ncbi:MAG: hypothetical protein LBF80_06970 [Spirochaetaceae bacterium]|jgi:hypothetical protein|nr:hypothetical protein [Spirochaetaceae bacterium]